MSNNSFPNKVDDPSKSDANEGNPPFFLSVKFINTSFVLYQMYPVRKRPSMMLISTQEDFHRDALGSTKTVLLLTVSMACLSPECLATLLNGPANQTLPLDRRMVT
jgi:hypothetical protein